MTALRIVAVNAGLSEPSSTRLLVDRMVAAVTEGLGAGRADVEIVDLRDLAADLGQAMTVGFASGRARAALDAVEGADALIVATPVFNASYSGLFKMFVDSLDTDALTGTPVLIAATAGTARHALVLDHAMRPLFSYLRAVVVPTAVFAATSDFGSAEEGLSERIHRAADQLAALVVAEPTGVEGFAPAAGDNRRTRRSGTDLGEVTPFTQLLRNHAG